MQRIAIDRFSRREQRARRSQGQLVAVGAAAADCRCAEAGPRIAACQDDAVQASSLFGMGSHVIPLPAQPSHPTSSCFFVRLTTSRFFVPA